MADKRGLSPAWQAGELISNAPSASSEPGHTQHGAGRALKAPLFAPS